MKHNRSEEPEKVRVGFVTPSLAMGGAERWMVSLAKHCDPKKIEWVGTVISPYAPAIAGLTSQMVRYMPIYGTDDIQGYLGDLTICKSLADAMKKLSSADILITWGFNVVGSITGPVNVPLVFVSHGDGQWTFDALLSSKDQCTHFAAVSQAAARVLPEGMPVIYNGIETSRCTPTVSREEFRQRWGIPIDATVIGYIGRYSVEKNSIAVAQAVHQINNPNVYALYCGEGQHQDELFKGVNSLVGDRVFILPFQQCVGDVLAGIDVFVLASDTEGFSLAMTEAWYASVPVVATRVGSVPELEKEFGKLVASVPVNPSPIDLVDAIEEALSIGFREDVIPRAKQMVIENFTAEKMGENWTDFILSIARQSANKINQIITQAEKVPGWMTRQELTWLIKKAISLDAGSTWCELGSHCGRSLLAVGLSLPIGSTLITIGDDWQDPVLFGVLRQIHQARKEEIKIHAIRCGTEEDFEGHESILFDVVFIDANHGYESCKSDIRNWANLMQAGGTICGHDYCDSWPGVKQAVDELLPERQVTESIWHYQYA